MSAVNHFVHGPLTPVLAYVMSCMGSMLGLRLTAQAHASRGASRMRWLLGAAISIGGTGIWVMHFVAMMGFEVEGTQIKYDVPLTVASAVVAIVVVGTGLFLVSYGGGRVLALLGGGLLTGLGVASMHYLGMYAMNMSAHVSYDRKIVAASVLIAVVAATVALWFTLRVKRAVWITGAALVMGVAVSGMHYTGMYAMLVTVDAERSPAARPAAARSPAARSVAADLRRTRPGAATDLGNSWIPDAAGVPATAASPSDTPEIVANPLEPCSYSLIHF